MSQKSNTRKISSLEESTEPYVRTKYTCNCSLCEGKVVDGRTQTAHTNDKRRWRSNKERKNQLAIIEARKYNRKGKQVDRLYTFFMHIGYMNINKLIVSCINYIPDISILTCVTFYLFRKRRHIK